MPIEQLVTWWNQTSAMDREYGFSAYNTYHTDIRRLVCSPFNWSRQCKRMCAAFALLSPNSSYEDNLRSLQIVVYGAKTGLPVEQLTGLTTYRACAARAYRVLAGESPETVFSPNAKKTYNFYRNIADPTDTSFVTIDGHMHNLWSGAGPRTLDKSGFSSKLYDTIAADFIAVAKVAGVRPCQFQATLWWCWKRTHGIRFQLQMPLVYTGAMAKHDRASGLV